MGRFTVKEKRGEALREVGMRNAVYGKRGPIAPSAQRRIDIMQEIADDYLKLQEPDNDE